MPSTQGTLCENVLNGSVAESMTEWMTVPQLDEGGCNREARSDGRREKRDETKNRGTGT